AKPYNGLAVIDTGSYLGLTPDGKFIVGFGPGGRYNHGRGLSWRIDHATRTVPTMPNEFWSLCGDHGSFLSSSDGRDYMVVANCHTVPEIWAVDITNNAAGLSEAQQRALPNNKHLIRWPTWHE